MATLSEVQRYERYQHVVCALESRTAFSIQEVAEDIPHETRQFVTRIVHELAKQGHLRRTDEGAFTWAESPGSFCAKRWLDAKVYGLRLTRTPQQDRPRERLLRYSASDLRLAELLAILIRSGRPGESALQAAEKLAACFADRLYELPECGHAELKAISPAVIEPAYCQIMAGIELGRRIERELMDRSQLRPDRISSADEAIAFCAQQFQRLAQDAKQEEFHLVCLDIKNQVIATHLISVGLLSQALVAPREVFRPAIRDAAASVIVVHNHPSGDATPSREDLAVTQRLDEVSQMIGIKLLDHIIVARHGCISIRQHEQFE